MGNSDISNQYAIWLFQSLTYYSMEWDQVSRYIFKKLQDQTGQKSNLFDAECVSLCPTVPIETTSTP